MSPQCFCTQQTSGGHPYLSNTHLRRRKISKNFVSINLIFYWAGYQEWWYVLLNVFFFLIFPEEVLGKSENFWNSKIFLARLSSNLQILENIVTFATGIAGKPEYLIERKAHIYNISSDGSNQRVWCSPVCGVQKEIILAKARFPNRTTREWLHHVLPSCVYIRCR